MSIAQILAGAAVAMAIVAAAIVAIYRRDLRSGYRRLKQHARIAQTRQGPIEYGAEGSGNPALVIHGAGGGYDQGLLIARSIPSGHQIIAPSRFGYLGTPIPRDASIAAQADAHAALLDCLAIERAIVAGASAGAPSAIELALRHPTRVRALILLVPRAYLPGRSVGVPMTASNKLVLNVILSGADLAYWLALRVSRRLVVRFMGVPPDLEARASYRERNRVTEVLQMVLPLSRRVAGIRLDSETALAPSALEHIQVPTLIITARDDLFDTLPAAEFTAARIRGAKLVVLETGGHLFVDRQREVSAAIADFLAALPSKEIETGLGRKSA